MSLVLADARQIPLREGCVQCVVTSPPYFGLRDYGTARWEGGDPDCDHRQQHGGEGASSAKQNTSAGTQMIQFRGTCAKCGAKRIDQQIGLEPSPDAYVSTLVAVFREVRRVLKDDGVAWLVLGDSYAGGGTIGRNDTDADSLARRAAIYGTGTGSGSAVGRHGSRSRVETLKPKDLIGIPWRVAFALQADGWYLRSDVIWAKPNPMPESVTDRPTKAHEYVFLLSRSERYYYDAQAIQEPLAESTVVWDLGKRGWGPSNTNHATAKGTHGPSLRGDGRCGENGHARNKRSVWTIPTLPYAGAHFATMPPALVEPCILAGSRLGDLVFDPFMGSGTVGEVAERLGRKWVGTDLNPQYQELAKERTAQRGLNWTA